MIKATTAYELLNSHLDRVNNRCEICGRLFDEYNQPHVCFIDNNPDNISDNNIALLCGSLAPLSCLGHFRLMNPRGITRENGQFVFAMNRGLY